MNGVDDTSNFDEVSPEPPSPSLDSLLSQQKFSGRELPFIGFTFTKPRTEPRLSKDRSVPGVVGRGEGRVRGRMAVWCGGKGQGHDLVDKWNGR